MKVQDHVIVMEHGRAVPSTAATCQWSGGTDVVVLELHAASDKGCCTGRFVGIAVTTHRSHLSSPGITVSSGAFFDEFGRLHHVR